MKGHPVVIVSLAFLCGCGPRVDAADFVTVENIEGVAHLRNASTDRLIKATYSCGGYTSQSVTLKPSESAMSDLGDSRCSKATVTSARFLDVKN
jgi:hypothetical protein